MLNLMKGMNGYTLCSGIISEDLNGEEYTAIRLQSDEMMTVGYISRKGMTLSALGAKYVESIGKYRNKAMK